MNIQALEQTLKSMNINPDACRLGSGLPYADEQYCVELDDRNWEVYYAEKGKKSDLQIFSSEEDACLYLLAVLEQDASVWLK